MMFSAMVRGAALVCCLATTTMAQSQSVRVQGAQIEHKMLRDVAVGQRVLVEKLQIPEGVVDLELDRVRVLTADAQLVVGSKDGFTELARPEVIILSGTIAGDPTSTAYLAVSEYGTNGFIEFNGEIVSISTGPYAQGKKLLESLQAARMGDVVNPQNAPPVCGYAPGDTALEPAGVMNEIVPNASRGAASCRIAGIAIETDWEYTDRMFSGNTNASAAYAVSLIGAISEIYERDLNVRLSIPFLRVWSDDSDPYVTTSDPLDQLRSEWNANMTSVDRTIVHYLTGRQNTSYGGVAYLSVLCNSSFGYGVSAYLTGSFPYPLSDHNSGNWDVVVAAHEIGHNFGTSHTHNYSPAIDGCGNGDCTDAFGGTIMSYCHTCSGGMNNLVLAFHSRVQDVVIGYMDSIACDLQGQGVSAIPDLAETIVDTVVVIDAIGNDEGGSCNAISLDSFDSVSAAGGTISLLAGQGPGGRDLFEYTPASGFDGADSFDYAVTDTTSTQSTTVSIDVRPLLQPVVRVDPIAGLAVAYYALSSPSVLPDFDTLTPYATDTASTIFFAPTTGEFMDSGLSDNVGVVFEGYVEAPANGLYTFTTDSDDGSKLLIGGQVVVNNDGLHGMLRAGGSIPLAAGWHPIRIEFFEAGGDAGLTATIRSEGISESILSGSELTHESGVTCPADFTGEGDLDIFDVLAFLDAFNAGDPAADFTGEGDFDIFDVLDFLDAFNAGCP